MKVVIAAEAVSDLEHIGDYIAADNPVRAESFVRELLARCHALAHMPRAFPLVPRYEHTGVRRRPHGDYLIFYRVGADVVDILHVLNGAQNYEAILFPDD
ncbi:type II toxin-antitoxin system RelE/ParE family toxin [Shinella sp. DD12]|uniref:type II toxin-antitoxin system RelE/ParE family toxin n=1 Tax=Shinella sp. DD12 TaxID=1410620 RepID=UPI000437BA5B|nr:type II toxin-antitoxin system RelE/ParE family toxin [Shinella sp. DD12]EYR79541.1 plasmid stabilization system protein [Shinella sp. DD12]